MAFDVRTMIDRYNADHQHPVNRTLHMVGVPTIIASLGVFPFNPLLGTSMFVFGWILQFIGHAFEGKAPTFFSDPKYLLVGALYFGKKLLGMDPTAA